MELKSIELGIDMQIISIIKYLSKLPDKDILNLHSLLFITESLK